ncbi:MAG: DUF4097 family beta strand repeat-containing protein [Acidobacteria bacterium]|nr:DUF4097 family beta strand repeat-containing protein [Acidobacteriota bacterium]
MNKHRYQVGVAVLGLLLASAPARALAAGPIDTWGDQTQTEKFNKTVALPKGGSFNLSNVSGDVVITGGPGEQIVIDATKRGRTIDDLKAVQITVVTSATRVEVRTEYPRERRNVNASVDFIVTLPRGAVVEVHSVSGDVKVSNVDGSLRAETVSGDVAVTSAAQLEMAKTVSGDVTVQTAASSGDVSIASVSGGAIVRSLKARSLEANSVSGDVELTDVTCERVKGNSISGSITFAGPLVKGGRYMLQSHSGDVTVSVNGKDGFELNASTFSGDIRSDLELTSKVGGPGDAESRHRRQTSMRGNFGDGSAVLELNAFSGNVTIVKK